ncbi:MAG: aconitase X [Candidatus Puniceispirillaceae bacterium]|jgi:predicted aconitase/predicted aconitase with swiveling domain
MTSEHVTCASRGKTLISGKVSGDILICSEGVSFWGGVDSNTGQIIDTHHSQYGQLVAGNIVMMPSSRGSCSGSGVLLALALANKAPAALIFSEPEEVLSLGALVASRIFNRTVPVIRLNKTDYASLANATSATITDNSISSETLNCTLEPVQIDDVNINENDEMFLAGEAGEAAKIAMEIICLMAAANDTKALIDISKGHIDGCILAHSANLIFAEKLADIGAEIKVPTTINAISVDRENWLSQNIPHDFGEQASRLADAYVRMGARPVFTCAPYLLEDPPEFGEIIGWSESNAVIFANSILGARTLKHPDYLDLFIAMTGRAPASGVYADAGRQPHSILSVTCPSTQPDDVFWPVLGWLAGTLSPNRIPVITGLEALSPTQDDLKSVCAAFGTTSGAAMLHISGHTPEADLPVAEGAITHNIDISDLQQAWHSLNQASLPVDLIAIGSPHASFSEVKRIQRFFRGRPCHPTITMIITVGRDTLKMLIRDGAHDVLTQSGVKIIPDICWCSINEPVLPVKARSIMTNSGKYAHYAYALSGRHARLSALQECVETAVTGVTQTAVPAWLR